MHPSKYEIVLKVEETKSFTKTAEYFQYTQSAISQAIKSLEAELNTTLFLRTPSGILLSEEGQYIMPAIREIVLGHRHLSEQIGELHNLQAGTVRLGGYLSLSWNYLPLLIKQFSSEYPNIKFELLQADDLTLLESLQKGNIDLAFMGNPEKRDYVYKELFEDPFLAIVPKNHQLAAKKKIKLTALENEDFISLDVGYSKYLKKMFDETNFTPQIKYRMLDDMTIISMVESGFGVSILPALVTKRNPFSVVKIPIIPSYSRHLGIVTKKDSYTSWAVQAFTKFASENVDKFL